MNIQQGQRNAPEHILDCEKKITKEEKNMNETAFSGDDLYYRIKLQ